MEKRSPGRDTKDNMHVKFNNKDDVVERKKKYLTAKYGQHQMALIRKRLEVETWLFDSLQYLYSSDGSQDTGDEVDLDLDIMLDIEDESERRHFLEKLLVDAKRPRQDVNKFIVDCLAKAKTL
ncbi:PREDICTED: uncharacterized protein LOC106815321 [Priapulus caudatus]|uniref:Uncharacterized protein LOC106815321 n=1 Tax=Priapulus caudatus TaxID=37621 RepID=A0ABM1EST3_PRICU|nr:PREDICTED: uncharacterized protein LOC106815321 [Priapulus caudatus]